MSRPQLPVPDRPANAHSTTTTLPRPCQLSCPGLTCLALSVPKISSQSIDLSNPSPRTRLAVPSFFSNQLCLPLTLPQRPPRSVRTGKPSERPDLFLVSGHPFIPRPPRPSTTFAHATFQDLLLASAQALLYFTAVSRETLHRHQSPAIRPRRRLSVWFQPRLACHLLSSVLAQARLATLRCRALC